MFLPTITYGFAIIYSFGREGLLTRLLGRQLFPIYGFSGLLLGYVIYTLPVCYVLLSNAMAYIDKKFITVSRLMGDGPLAAFLITVLQPMLGTLGASFVQAFFLSFTDFGIPASVGGEYEVIASVLYDQMLGSIPNFHNGAVVSMTMLIPSVISIALLRWLDKYSIRYSRIAPAELKRSPARDIIFGVHSVFICLSVLSVFAVYFCYSFFGGLALSDTVYPGTCILCLSGHRTVQCVSELPFMWPFIQPCLEHCWYMAAPWSLPGAGWEGQ